MQNNILKHRSVWLVEFFPILTDIALIAFCYTGTPFQIGVALLCDLLLVSPLCAGKALFYSTFDQDIENAAAKLLFRYYRFGYGKAVSWRIQLWLKGLQATLLCSVPVTLLAVIREQFRDQPIVWLSLSLLYRFSIFASVIVVCLVVLYWRPCVHLLPYVPNAAQAFSAYKRVYKDNPHTVWDPYRYLFCRLPFVFLVLPIFYLLPQLHLKQSENIRSSFGISCEKKCAQVLQPSKRYGIIGGISLKH